MMFMSIVIVFSCTNRYDEIIEYTNTKEENMKLEYDSSRIIYIHSGVPGYDVVDFKISDSMIFAKLPYECDTTAVLNTNLTGVSSFYLQSYSLERIFINKYFSGNYWNITPKSLGL